jgi:hypothetical protein
MKKSMGLVSSGMPKSAQRGLLGVLVGAVFCLCSDAVFAQDSLIGFVKTVHSEASLIVDGKPIKAVPGMPLQAGFVIKTGPQGSLGMTLRDNTMMSVGPNTELVVEQYLYSPSNGELKLWARLSRGTLQYVSGVIAKLKPEGVAIRIPTGVVGVRGTQFLLMVEDEKS